MKAATYICTLFLLFPVNGVTQLSKERELSNVEKFSVQTGSLIVKEFQPIGSIGDVTLDVLTLTDLMTKHKMMGLRLSKDVSKSYGSETKSAFLDPDEVEALIKSINAIQSYITETVNGMQTKKHPKYYTEINFVSRGGFSFGVFFDKSKGSWTPFMRLEKYDSDSYEWLEASGLQSVLNRVWDAKKIINPSPGSN